MKTQIESNQRLWDELTQVHLKGSETYPIDAFKKGENVLNNIELEEVGSVKGKRLLHLQCHFGMDTLSWARLGAEVTGVDFSTNAIEAARQLSRETEISAEFIQSDIASLRDHLDGVFDIVFASYGALYWIPDLADWLAVASHFLAPGGFLYVVDGHPFYHWLNRDESETDLAKFKYSYFDRTVQRYDSETDYADVSYVPQTHEFGWHFTVGDIINGAIQAGLTVDFFHEFPAFKLEKYQNAWQPIGGNSNFPVMFSIKATKRQAGKIPL